MAVDDYSFSSNETVRAVLGERLAAREPEQKEFSSEVVMTTKRIKILHV